MKKLVSVLFVSLLVGGMAFAADPTLAVTAWGRAVYNLYEGASADTASTTVDESKGTVSTIIGYQRVGFTVKGTSDNAGIQVDVYAKHFGTDTTIDNFIIGDQAKMWITVGPMATVSFGKIQGDTLRGKIGGGWISSGGIEDSIFKRFYPNKGLLLDLAPISGLYVGAAIDSDTVNNKKSAEDVYKAIQAGAGYTIQDVGLIRAQYVGNATTGKPFMQAAFAFTGMKDLTVDAGVKIPTDSNVVGLSVAGGAKYVMGAVTVAPRVVYTAGVANDDAATAVNEKNPQLDIQADFGYALDSIMSVNVEASYKNLLNDATTTLAATPYLKLAYAKGELRVGATISVATPSSGSAVTSWAIPVGFQVSF